jgi:polygalacturonase
LPRDGIFDVAPLPNTPQSKAIEINKPTIWWSNVRGEWPNIKLYVYGLNLGDSVGNPTVSVTIASAETRNKESLTVSGSDPYRVCFALPEELTNGEYTVEVFERERADVLYSRKVHVTTPVKVETIDIRSYGAKGDGINDDTGAIKAAIEAARQGNKAVYIPQGTFVINDTLEVHDGAWLLGEWPNSKIRFEPSEGAISTQNLTAR